MLKHNFQKFLKNLDKKINKKIEDAKDLFKNTSVNFLENVQNESPVLSGRYKAGHILTKNSPSNEIPFEGGDFSSMAANNLNDAKNIRVSKNEKVFVTNNVPYAKVIEYGSTNRPAELVFEKSKVKTKRFYDIEKRRKGFK